MSLQTLYITKRCFLKIERNQLVIEGMYKIHIPVEDIATIVIESRNITLTSACLSVLAENGCNVIICGKDHNPNSIQLPFLPHSRQALVNRKQWEWSDAFKKRCHQRIIHKKIKNQARCYYLSNGHNDEKLEQLTNQVKLGDKENTEAQAASHYFAWYLAGRSRKEKDYFPNMILNYGYSILRSSIARYLTTYGFIPSIGLFHRSDLNNFNLADDMIEPFRPFVDLYIKEHYKENKSELEKEDKALLLKLPEMELLNDRSTLLSSFIEESIQSLKRATDKNDSNMIKFPDLFPLQERIYE